MALAAAVVALPFLLRPNPGVEEWRPGDPELVVISPHNEAIRQEFGSAFSRWHQDRYGKPVKVDWRVIGGTTEIMRYLESEYRAGAAAWWSRQGNEWPPAGGDWVLDRRFDPSRPPPDAEPAAAAAWCAQRKLWLAFRGADDPAAVSCQIDVFFGGGVYDHEKAARQGLTVAPWRPEHGEQPPEGLFADADGNVLIPTGASGEAWRGEAFFGTVLSTFGICYNPDRLADLGITEAPAAWCDLTDGAYFGQVGITDPTKSGSVAKAFEMIIHEACWESVRSAGYGLEQVRQWEAAIAASRLPPGAMPTNVPTAYQQAIERGWVAGVNRVRLIGANARYFTDGAGKVPIDVSTGVAAAGIAIDFYGRFQAESSAAPDGTPRMVYVTPVGGSSVSADPISLLRGAPRRELAVRFITFVLGPDGQKLWNYRPGAPGGPRRFALRRLPIRRDFYPSEDAGLDATSRVHAAWTSDPLTASAIDPYRLAASFHYQPRWTERHFGVQRDLVRAMCLDAGEELRDAWKAILDHGGPAACPEAMARLNALPEVPVALTWRSAISEYMRTDRHAYMREWVASFRDAYREAASLARKHDAQRQ